MKLFNYTKKDLDERAAELNFVANTLEKVLRLADILKFINSNIMTRTILALKGGTAINLTIFDLEHVCTQIPTNSRLTQSQPAFATAR